MMALCDYEHKLKLLLMARRIKKTIENGGSIDDIERFRWENRILDLPHADREHVFKELHFSIPPGCIECLRYEISVMEDVATYTEDWQVPCRNPRVNDR
jgi:hypothetical protein